MTWMKTYNWDERVKDDGLEEAALKAAFDPEAKAKEKAQAEAGQLLERFRAAIQYSPAQRVMYFESEGHKYRIFPKGRRLGATRGAAHACIEWALQGYPILWGDTVTGNIRKYLDRYFKPALDAAKIPYHWNAYDNMLTIGTGYIDFRSAEMDLKKWEGFGYRRIFLNEAGIILADPYLFLNAVLPMMMDFADSELIAAGTPKGKLGKEGGKHKYFELYERAKSGEEGYFTQTFTSYDNPFLPEGSVQELLDAYGGMDTAPARQEVFGEFLDGGDDSSQIIPRSWVLLAFERWKAGVGRPPLNAAPDQIGVDPARGGDDYTVLAQRYDSWVAELQAVHGKQTPTGREVAGLILSRAAPHTLVQIDLGAVGSSPVDYTTEHHPNTRGINFGTPTRLRDKRNLLRMRNYRAAMYWNLRELLDPASGEELALPPDDLLLEELTATTWFLGGSGVQIPDKESIKRVLGRSPDRADAVVLACWQAPRGQVAEVPTSVSYPYGSTGTLY